MAGLPDRTVCRAGAPRSLVREFLRAGITSLLVLASGASPALSGDERWYEVRWFGQTAGWTREEVIATEPGGQLQGEGLRLSETSLRISRLGTEVALWTRSEYRPSDSSRVAEIKVWSASAPEDTLILVCRFDADSLRIHKTQQGRTSQQSLPRSSSLLLPEELEARLQQNQQPGAELRYEVFLPELESITAFTARAEARDTLEIQGERRPALRWRHQSSSLPGLEILEWRDPNGVLLRSEHPALQLVLTLSTEEALQRESAPAEVLAALWIPLNRTLDPEAIYAAITYRITTASRRTPFSPLDHPMLEVDSRSDSTVVLGVQRQHPADDPPSDRRHLVEVSEESRMRALRSTLLIQADAPAIRAAARGAADGETDPWRLSLKLRDFVAHRIERKDLEVTFGSALWTLERGQGDCTEHALLLAALARSLGIPARLVAGLVALDDGMGYHLWTEVLIGGRWIGVDAALERAPVDARYLPLAVSDLAEGSPAALIGGLFSAIGQIQVAIEEALILQPAENR